MSQNKTVIPGVDYNSYDEANAESLYGNMYSRSTDDDKRTFVPDVSSQPSASPVGVLGHNIQAATNGIGGSTRQITLQERVVVGVLFSVSRGLLGEIFPLYLGRNIIGQTANSDVTLSERTVSPAHAILHTKKSEHGYEAEITDFNSVFGTRVNEEDARYDTLPVKENDIITIGSHYKFVVKFFDIEQHGMTEDADFDDTGDNTHANTQNNSDISNDFYRPSSKENEDSSRTVIY